MWLVNLKKKIKFFLYEALHINKDLYIKDQSKSIMAGSQLKQLKAALRENGLTGQTNIKKKGKTSKRAPSDTRRDDMEEKIQMIREQFNPFEIKVNKKKTQESGRFVKGAQGKPGISKQIGEDQRKAAWEARKASKNKSGVLRDRRFGENDTSLNPEEKMLERFTRERQMQSSKTSLFNLDGDESDDEGLTHYGKSLSLKDDFQEDDLENSDDEFLRPKKRALEIDDRDENDEEEPVVPKKKTKAEVMKEVMAKSKFYKQQRQAAQEEREGQIEELDDEFADVLQALGTVPKTKPPVFETPKDANAINYEQSVRELNMDRRAAPADRTKTEEELKKEWDAKQKELEQARLRRMQGEDYGDDKGPDELDDDFWGGNSEDEAQGLEVYSSEDLGEDSDLESEEETTRFPASKNKIACPQTLEEFHSQLEDAPLKDTPKHVEKIITLYSPRLQAGNKEKLAVFTTVVFQHILYLSESEEVDSESFKEVQELLIAKLKKLSEKFNTELAEFLREKIKEIQERITETVTGADEYPRISDLVFFALVGMLYSTSDHYHLIVTPSLILMGETLEQIKYNSLNLLVAGTFISNIVLTYQRIAKRYIPEVTYFLQKALLSIAPLEISDKAINAKSDVRLPLKKKLSGNSTTLRISDVDRELKESHKEALFGKIISVLDIALDTWKEKTALIEIAEPFTIILSKYQEAYLEHKQVSQVLDKFTRLLKFAKDERKPLALQTHKKVAIATYAPKFEENYNPEKKSYDHDRQRQEVSKMRHQIKQERKIALRELRKDTRFEARQQIKEKKDEHDAYHSKMARILNSINTVEGAEKNAYDRERKSRKGKK